jgi:hypothetical protein
LRFPARHISCISRRLPDQPRHLASPHISGTISAHHQPTPPHFSIEASRTYPIVRIPISRHAGSRCTLPLRSPSPVDRDPKLQQLTPQNSSHFFACFSLADLSQHMQDPARFCAFDTPRVLEYHVAPRMAQANASLPARR